MLMGKQSIDGDNSQTGPMLAGLLDWSEASYISSLSIMNPDVLKVEEETETGRRTLEVHLPSCHNDRFALKYTAISQVTRHCQGEEEADEGNSSNSSGGTSEVNSWRVF